VDYLTALPRLAFNLRAAVWWPLALGVKTLEKLRVHPSPVGAEAPVKVSRREVYGILGASVVQLPVNRFVRAGFNDLASAASSSMEQSWKNKSE
jgi:hypothetical protein